MVYLRVVECVPLGRWNNIANGNGRENTDIILAVLQAAIFIFFLEKLAVAGGRKFGALCALLLPGGEFLVGSVLSWSLTPVQAILRALVREHRQVSSCYRRASRS